ncbi:DEAD/DEAH box helicase [Nisaea acidiphila]|uniref:DEAD-box ATP-dependent RNA helicase RhpA n=1 Tax=Nisaea acidiphila TaxID=1862145 RepID=A0A9J7AUY4_9PROT|nr:DEAD/DEAH box helicase [Nisaea acidiphila]UUX50273.1 DEAD/DEAH box helicase [Nisaea acidiphila]
MTFSDLGLSDAVVSAVTDAGYTTPTPIQEQAIPHVLMGRDILGCAQTGTGKTASFTLPMIDILAAGRAKARMPRSLILCPTRELAAQVADNFVKYGKNNQLSMALLIGGVAFSEQEQKLDRGVDVLIATPGRLLDHFERGRILLTDVKVLVIDEADRMLDMGFIPDVERIVSLLPRIRQTLFFSATISKEIRKLADAFLINPKEITVAAASSAAETVKQWRAKVAPKDKRAALRSLIDSEKPTNAIIFCNRKRDVGVVHRSLKRHGYNAVELHGDMSQPDRMKTLQRFKDGDADLLCASDVAARGLDIAGLSHVFNFDVPTHAEDYVHRIGRTGRAGREGRAFTLTTSEEAKYLQAIIKLIGKDIPVCEIPGLTAADGGDAAQEEERGEEKRERGGRRKSRSRGGRDGRSDDTPKADNVTDFPAKEARPSKRRRNRDEDADLEPVVGLGDHVPAFLLRK